MKVILLGDIRGVGRRFGIKEVSEGYARNFLLPRGLAKIGDKESLRKLQIAHAIKEKEDETRKKRLQEIARTISDITLEFVLASGERGLLFGSVTKEAILKTLRDKKVIGAERVDVLLSHPLKEVGSYKITIDLKMGIEATLAVMIRPQP